jgi:hypothetical protein
MSATLLATLLDNGYVISATAFASLSIGGVVGHGVRGVLLRRAAYRRDDVLIKQAIVGTPATEFSPHQPGLIELMSKLRADFEAHTTHPPAANVILVPGSEQS